MAQDVSSRDKINLRIKELEHQEAVQMVELKKRVQDFKHSVAPAALVGSAYAGIRDNKQVQGNIIDRSAGMAVGWLLRKILTPKSGGIIKRIGGYALQYAATKFITNKMPAIREKVHFNRFIK